MTANDFLDVLWGYYTRASRQLPWRTPESDGYFDFYKIAISELMLQQTQVDRVIPKYRAFLELFPDPLKLANAPFADVLKAWSGLGYNRRALYVHDWAKAISLRSLPTSVDQLCLYKGFGYNTAAAVFVYTYNQPLLFVETNIRTVILHHFFEDVHSVTDTAITQKLEQLLDRENPREFYWAMMDYGSYLKKQHKNINHRSALHVKQSLFEGSNRQLRGRILRYMQQKDVSSEAELMTYFSDTRTLECIEQLVREGFLKRQGKTISLSD